jgi:hypothetical protein
MRLLPLISAGMLITAPAFAAPAFDLSASYAPRTSLVPGYYACRSGLDFDRFTFTFDLQANGRYKLRGQVGEGQLVMSPVDGTIDFKSGPFTSDSTAKTYARNTTRLSDGNAVIIIRYDFGNKVTNEYCARVR